MTTDKYGLHEVEYSVQGWDTIMNTDMNKLDDVIHTNLIAILGETIAQYDAVGLFRGETKYKKALANRSKQPALGLALVAGVLDDSINIQRVGPITNSGWSWTIGLPVYLSNSVAGGLIQNPPLIGKQLIGIAVTATTIILGGMITDSAIASTTTTTTSSTTTTTSSTTTTTTSP